MRDKGTHYFYTDDTTNVSFFNLTENCMQIDGSATPALNSIAQSLRHFPQFTASTDWRHGGKKFGRSIRHKITQQDAPFITYNRIALRTIHPKKSRNTRRSSQLTAQTKFCTIFDRILSVRYRTLSSSLLRQKEINHVFVCPHFLQSIYNNDT